MSDDRSPTDDDGSGALEPVQQEPVPPATEVLGAEALGTDPLAAMGGEGGLDLGAMMQMAQDMSERMGDAQSELAEARVEGSAGGGLVKVVLNGHLHLLDVVIEPTAVDPEDPSILGDLIVAAWRDAHDDVARLQAAADPLGGLGGALGGGLGDLFGGG
ncbi:MAG: YbaB/EbfC family nucleoid-associated protein [Microthrixaceae bacterium]|nr:YbaB/EbfC family nucleoid-associated protein [Microthrixaceae bacterium]